MARQRRRTLTGRRIETAAVVAVVTLGIGALAGVVPLAIGAALAAAAVAADLLVQ